MEIKWAGLQPEPSSETLGIATYIGNSIQRGFGSWMLVPRASVVLSPRISDRAAGVAGVPLPSPEGVTPFKRSRFLSPTPGAETRSPDTVSRPRLLKGRRSNEKYPVASERSVPTGIVDLFPSPTPIERLTATPATGCPLV